MKNKLVAIVFFAGFLTASAQVITTTQISDFEHVTLTSEHNKVYNDSTGGGGFKSGNAYFPSQWDTAYGGYWESGWAASAVYDSTNSYPNLYGCAAYKGYTNSNKFAVGTTSGSLIMRMTDSLIGKTVVGMYICNSTYAYKSMKNGDSYESAFSAKNHDWFKLTAKKYFGGVLVNDSAEVYLADFRYADTTQNYILNTWTWVNFSSLGNVDSLTFSLSSSQNGAYGMNTPAFFCIDNVNLSTYRDTSSISGIENYNLDNSVVLYPNPASAETEIIYNTFESVPVYVKLTDLLGNELISQKGQSFVGLNKFRFDLSFLPQGVYCVALKASNRLLTRKLIKQ